MPRLYKDVRRNETIRRHHQKYQNDIYAPAWKTLEYMTFGSMLYLFENIKDEEIKDEIMHGFGLINRDAFLSQMQAIRLLRNVCAHGHNLYDLKFPKPVKPGKIKELSPAQRSSFSGGLMIVASLLSSISINRRNELLKRIENLLSNHDFVEVLPIIKHVSPSPAQILS